MKIRVLEVLATLRRAGAERVAVTLARGLDRARFEPAVVSLYAPFEGGFEPLLAEAAVPVWHLGKRRGFDPRMWSRLAGVIREFHPAIVHTHSYVMRYAWPACLLARQGCMVHTVHNLAEREVDAFGRAVHRMAFRGGAVPVAISDRIAASFREVYGHAPAATIPNGVDVAAPAAPEARAEWRCRFGIGPDDFVVASVARLEAQKNPALLVEAFAHTFGGQAKACPTGRACFSLPAHLVIAGEGTLLASTRKLAQDLGIASRVHFAGLVADIPGLLSAADAFALSSSWEGSPVAVIEAMAAGLPIIATSVGAIPELVFPGETGILVPPGNAAALAEALAVLAADPSRRAAMSSAARARAARFDGASMIRAYAGLFAELAGGPR